MYYIIVAIVIVAVVYKYAIQIAVYPQCIRGRGQNLWRGYKQLPIVTAYGKEITAHIVGDATTAKNIVIFIPGNNVRYYSNRNYAPHKFAPITERFECAVIIYEPSSHTWWHPRSAQGDCISAMAVAEYVFATYGRDKRIIVAGASLGSASACWIAAFFNFRPMICSRLILLAPFTRLDAVVYNLFGRAAQLAVLPAVYTFLGYDLLNWITAVECDITIMDSLDDQMMRGEANKLDAAITVREGQIYHRKTIRGAAHNYHGLTGIDGLAAALV